MRSIQETINWLLFNSGISGYEISKQTGISTTTLHRLKTGKQSIGQLSLTNALKLFELAKTKE